MKRILLVFLMGALFMGSHQSMGSDAKVRQCQLLLQPVLSSTPEAIRVQIQKLTEALLSIHSVEDLLSAVSDTSKDIRGKVFFVEAFGQILKHFKKSSDISSEGKALIEANFKALEDMIGKHNEKDELLEAAKAMKLDNSFITFLQGQSRESLVKLYAYMEQEQWIGTPEVVNLKMSSVYESLAELDWSKSKTKDHKKFFAALESLFKAYKNKMTDDMQPLLEEKNWEFMKNMEEGLHEVRRLFRWVMIVMQMRPELFSYSKAPTLNNLKDLPPAALEIAKKSLIGALAKKDKSGKSSMLEFGINQLGTIVLSPEVVFYISGLVDDLAVPKRKSEMYFNMQREIRAFLTLGNTLGGHNANSSEQEIQDYIIFVSEDGGDRLNLQGVFEAGSENPFKEVRNITLKLLEDFWAMNPLKTFQKEAEKAKYYWKAQE